MKYLYAEHLKWKRTMSNKLIWIAPVMTVLFAWFVGGFTGGQYMSFYWWYTFLLPGTIAILCALSVQKEERAGKCHSLLSMPVDIGKMELAKAGIVIEKLFAAAIILAVLVSVNHVIAPVCAVYSLGRCIIGSIGIIAASVWQIPLCLLLARKTGMLLPIIVNTVLAVVLPGALGSTWIGWVFPHYWAARLAKGILGIEINGTFSGNLCFSLEAFVVTGLSVMLFVLLALLDMRDFSQKEGR